MSIHDDMNALADAMRQMGATAAEAADAMRQMASISGGNGNMPISSTVKGSVAFQRAVGHGAIGVSKVSADRDITKLSDIMRVEGVINKKVISNMGYATPMMKFNVPVPGGPISVELRLRLNSESDAYSACLTFALPDHLMVGDPKNTQGPVPEFKDAVKENMQKRIDQLQEALAESNTELQGLKALTGKLPSRRQIRRRNSG